MKMVRIKLHEVIPGTTTLSSRELGAVIRSKIENALQFVDTVVLDFEGIELITQSFGDEILGVLVRRLGFPVIKEKVKVANANPLIKQVLKFVISYSRKNTSSLRNLNNRLSLHPLQAR